MGGGGEFGGDIVDGDSGIVWVVDSFFVGVDVGEDEFGVGFVLGECFELVEEVFFYFVSVWRVIVVSIRLGVILDREYIY